MKTRISLFAALAAIACLFTAQSALGAIVGPYTADANTVHLLHLDESNPGPPSDSGSSPSAWSNHLNADLGATAFTGFGTAGNIGNPGDHRGWRTDISGDQVLGSTDGAFTLETLINFRSTSAGEILREGSNTALRVYYLGGSSGFQVAVPTQAGGEVFTAYSGNTPTTSTWYHLAVVYDGQAAGANDLRFYFTEMDDSNTSANLTDTFTTSGTTPYASVFSNFQYGIGSGGNSNAFVDELRISNIARAADDMMFSGAVPEPSSFVLAGLGLVGLVGYSLRRRKK